MFLPGGDVNRPGHVVGPANERPTTYAAQLSLPAPDRDSNPRNVDRAHRGDRVVAAVAGGPDTDHTTNDVDRHAHQ